MIIKLISELSYVAITSKYSVLAALGSVIRVPTFFFSEVCDSDLSGDHN